jgi:hypothetical protein
MPPDAVDSFLVDEIGTIRRQFPVKSKLTGLDSIYKYIDDTLLSRYDCEVICYNPTTIYES